MKLNIGYFADGPWSHQAFTKLIQIPDISISFICGRYKTKDQILKNFAKEFKIDYLEHNDVNSSDFISLIKNYKCNLFVSMSFDQIFKKDIIKLMRHNIINCHAGKLPFYRGRSVLNWVLINDEKEFGITVHYIDEGIDSGDIILQRSYEITDLDDYKTLLNKAYIKCADILYESILMLKKGDVKTQKQINIHPVGSYFSKRKKGDEILNWNQSSRAIFNFVRAIKSPGPCARAFIGKKEMKISQVECIENDQLSKSEIGTIIKKKSDYFLVKTKDSFLKVISYEYDGEIEEGNRFEV